MKIKQLELTNFRNIDHMEIEFINPNGKIRNFTILIGDNSTGKTAVLEAITKALVPVVRGINKEAVKESDLKDIDIKYGENWTHLSLKTVFGKDEYQCSNKRRVAKTGEVPLVVAKDTLKAKYKECFERGYLPLVLYYGTDRVVKGVPIYGHIKDYKIEDALKNCFKNDNYFRDFYDWFKTEEDIELREKREDTSYSNGKLDCVRLAIEKMIPQYTNLRIKLNPKRMVVTDFKKQDLRIDQLSDGYKAVLSMVADIAKRLAMAYPRSEQPLQEEAVILIDEIDLHLHPKWQRNIVEDLKRTFPNCQFIISTHSPFIVQSVDKGEVINLDSDNQDDDRGSYQGWSLEEIQEYTMGVETKTSRYNHLLKLFSLYMDNEEYDQVKQVYVELKEMTHPTSAVRKIIDMDIRSIEDYD